MNILRLFNRPKMTTKEILSQPTGEAWKRLVALGYTMIRSSSGNGKSSYSFWKDGGMMSDEWSRPLTVDEANDMREQWAQMELVRLQEASE